MSRIHLALGGIRSGKSAYAEELAAQWAAGGPVVYLATGAPVDAAMTERIRRHRARRPPHWHTLEAPLNPTDALRRALPDPVHPPVLLLDSLDGWVSNLMLSHETTPPAELQGRIVGAVRLFAAVARELRYDAVIVSSEVGQSLVATSPLGRQFQDLLGTVNQAMAAASDEVTLVVAGIPVPVQRRAG